MYVDPKVCSCGKAQPTKSVIKDENGDVCFFSCGKSECKEEWESQLKTTYNEKYRQGKSEANYESSMKTIIYTMYVMGCVIAGYLLHCVYLYFKN